LAEALSNAGFESGGDFALASATVGILGAILLGMTFINWKNKEGSWMWHKARHTHYPNWEAPVLQKGDHENAQIHLNSEASSSVPEEIAETSIDPLALHVGLAGMAVFIGFWIKAGLVGIEGQWKWADENSFFESFPLFPIAMIGGMILQYGLSKFGDGDVVDCDMNARVGGVALDFLVVAAIATVDVEAVGEGIFAFAVLMISGLLWHTFMFLFIAPILLPDFWFERALVEMGRSMGVTATGLVLLRIVDPEGKSPVYVSFSYKCLLQEPFMGGGLWTTSAVTIIAQSSPWTVMGVSIGAIVVNLVVFMFVMRPKYLSGENGMATTSPAFGQLTDNKSQLEMSFDSSSFNNVDGHETPKTGRSIGL
jgi:ESS family glutamate:Na+ symporter